MSWLSATRTRRRPPRRGRVPALRASLGTLVVGVAIFTALTGAAVAPAAGKPVLTIGMTNGPITFDPALDGVGPYNMVRSLTNTSITRLNNDGSYGPGLATSFHYIGVGNKNFEFTLRPNARFSNGERVTAQAVKKWLLYFASANGPFVSSLGPIRSIDTVGKLTVKLHLKSPNPILPFVLSDAMNAGAVVAPGAVDNKSVLGSKTFGAGPYTLVPSQSVTNDHYTLLPNKFFYDKSQIRFSKVVIKIIPTPSSMLAAAETGQVDVAIGGPSSAGAAKSAGLNVVTAPTQAEMLIFANRASKPLSDVRVRQALNYLVDRKTFCKATQGAYGQPTSSILTTDGNDPRYNNYYSYDVAKAKSLLASAGYSNGFSLDVLDGPGSGGGSSFMQAMSQYFGAAGIKVNIVPTATTAAWAAKALSGTMPAFFLPVGGDPMWLFYGLFLKPHSVGNQHGAGDPVIDKLWLKGQRAANATTQWKQITAQSVTQALFLPVCDLDSIFYVSKKIGGVVPLAASPNPLASEWFVK